MIKRVIFLFLMIAFNFCLAQKVRFELHIVKQCTGIILVDTNFTLYRQSLSDTNRYEGAGGAVLLPDIGDYQLFIHSDPYAEIPLMKIRDTGLYVYTYSQPRLYLYYSGASDDPGYYVYCDKKINGYQDDFFPNGNCRTRGTFNNGRIKDSVVIFYSNGKTKMRISILPNENLREEFDSLGHKSRVSHYSNRPGFRTDYQTTEYYSDGTVKLNKVRTGDLLVIEEKEFYPNGVLKVFQTKGSRTEYSDQERKELSYKWKFKKEVPPGDFYQLVVIREKYDQRGNILTKFVGEANALSNAQEPDFDDYKIKYNWVDSSEKFENGKMVFSVKKMDADIYFKKYPED